VVGARPRPLLQLNGPRFHTFYGFHNSYLIYRSQNGIEQGGLLAPWMVLHLFAFLLLRGKASGPRGSLKIKRFPDSHYKRLILVIIGPVFKSPWPLPWSIFTPRAHFHIWQVESHDGRFGVDELGWLQLCIRNRAPAQQKQAGPAVGVPAERPE